MTGSNKPTWIITGMLSVFLTATLIILTAVLFIGSYLAIGEERSSSFANTFFIQCIIFTIVLGLASQTRRFVSEPLGMPSYTGLEYLSLRPASWPVVLLSALAGALLTIPLGELDNLWQYVWPASDNEILTMLTIYEADSMFEKVFIILALVVAAPLGEEMVFRGVMWNWMKDTAGPVAALVVTSVLFGSAHVFIPRTILLIIPVGLLLGFLVLRSGSIMTSIAAHAAFNGTPLLFAWSGLVVTGWNNIGAEEPRLHPGAAIGGTAAFAACLLGIWWLTRGRAEPPQPSKPSIDDDPRLH